jgi:ABC-type spermidine/putrescine transport system permease subunit I
LQLGVIPKLYGYLGAYSVSGFWGLFSNNSIFSYSPIGVSFSLFFIYAPFFFIPFLSSLKSHTAFTKSFIIQDVRSIDKVVTLLKVYKREFIYASILFFAFTIMDFTCSDLVGGGKYDTYGKALHKTAIYFRDYFSAFVFGVGFLLIIMFGLKKAHYEKG